jgi:hypothetical protein
MVVPRQNENSDRSSGVGQWQARIILGTLVALFWSALGVDVAAAEPPGIYQHTRHVIASDGYWEELAGDEPGPESYWVEYPHVVVYDKYLFSVAYEPGQTLHLTHDQTLFELAPRIGAYAYEPLYYIAYEGAVETPYLSLPHEYMGFAWYIDYGNLDQAPVWFDAASFEAELDRAWGETVIYAGLTEVDPPLYHTLPYSEAWGLFRLERDEFGPGEPLSGTLHGVLITTQVIPESSWLVAVALGLGLWLGARRSRRVSGVRSPTPDSPRVL